MAASKPQPIKAHVITDFYDVGTGAIHLAGDTPTIEAGTFANYEAAGLVRAADPQAKAKTAG